MSDRVRREVVSFVRRSDRMNASQTRAWERYANRWVVSVPNRETATSVSLAAQLDWSEIFGRKAPLIVEIGSGRGDALIPAAAAAQDQDFVAFEVFLPSIATCLGRIARAQLSNVRMAAVNGVEALSRLVEPDSVAELWTFFPDPWHKVRHHKRRLINRDFGALVASRLAPGGVWRIATDWADYAEWIAAELADHEDLTGGIVPRWAGREITKYEKRGLAEGREITDFAYRRRS